MQRGAQNQEKVLRLLPQQSIQLLELVLVPQLRCHLPPALAVALGSKQSDLLQLSWWGPWDPAEVHEWVHR